MREDYKSNTFKLPPAPNFSHTDDRRIPSLPSHIQVNITGVQQTVSFSQTTGTLSHPQAKKKNNNLKTFSA